MLALARGVDATQRVRGPGPAEVDRDLDARKLRTDLEHRARDPRVGGQRGLVARVEGRARTVVLHAHVVELRACGKLPLLDEIADVAMRTRGLVAFDQAQARAGVEHDDDPRVPREVSIGRRPEAQHLERTHRRHAGIDAHDDAVLGQQGIQFGEAHRAPAARGHQQVAQRVVAARQRLRQRLDAHAGLRGDPRQVGAPAAIDQDHAIAVVTGEHRRHGDLAARVGRIPDRQRARGEGLQRRVLPRLVARRRQSDRGDLGACGLAARRIPGREHRRARLPGQQLGGDETAHAGSASLRSRTHA